MSHKRRIAALECLTLEAEIARIDRYYQTISYAEMELFVTITEELMAGALSREYSPDEVEFYNRHVDTINGFFPAAMAARTRRDIAELLATGAVTQAEVDEIFKTQEDHDQKL